MVMLRVNYKYENVSGLPVDQIDALVQLKRLYRMEYNATTKEFWLEVVIDEDTQDQIETLMLAETGETYAYKREVFND